MTKRTQNVRLVPRIPATSFSSCLGVFFLYQPYKHSRDHSSAPDPFVSVATHRLLFRDLLVTYTLYVTVPKHEIQLFPETTFWLSSSRKRLPPCTPYTTSTVPALTVESHEPRI